MPATATIPEPHPANANGATVPPAEYVRALPPEAKHAVFLALLREALQFNGESGLLPIDDEDGRPFGYYVPPPAAAARADAFAAQMPPEVRDCLLRPMPDLNLDDTLSDEEVGAIITRAADSAPR